LRKDRPAAPQKSKTLRTLLLEGLGGMPDTRLVGILLGEGLTIGEAKERLQGVTPESPVVAERVARAVKKTIVKGVCKREDFPLLLHIDGILTEGRPAPIPYTAFETNGF
jgi:glycerol-3-phosphate dehydrogenase (NAD(P)+)